MSKKILFVLIVFLFACPAPVFSQGQPGSRYRVEIIVLQHLDSSEEAREVPVLEDYSGAIDFLAPPSEEEEEEETDAETDVTANGQASGLEETMGDASPEVAGESVPGSGPAAIEAVKHVESPGAEMQDAWRRLRLSAPFRPLQFLAWEQYGSEPFPALRIHDDEVVLTEDPWADQRAALVEQSEGLVFSDVATAPPAEEEGAEEAALPDPLQYYRLDGTAMLVRKRFLHLDLDLEYREPVFAGEPDLQASLTGQAQGEEVEPPRPTGFLLHRLQQSRQVRSGRMEYFDGPFLGVLARITDISDTLTGQGDESPE